MPEALAFPINRGIDANGLAIGGAQAYFYDSGTLNLRTVYADEDLTTPHTNPVVADSGGLFPNIYLNPDYAYRLILKTGLGVTVADTDPIASDGGLFDPNYPGSVNQTITAKLEERVSVRDFGAVGDGVADDSAAFVAAIAYLKSIAGNLSNNGFYKGSTRLFVPAGHYYMGTTTLEITHSFTMEGEGGGRSGGASSRLRWAAGATGIRVQRYNTSGSATVDGATHFGGDSFAILRIKLEGGYTNTEGEFHGIHAKAPITVGDDVYIYKFQGEGIRLRATLGGAAAVEGSVSVSAVSKTRIEACRIAIYVSGNDANVISFDAVDFSLNRQAGYVGDAGIGANTLRTCHAAFNGVGQAGLVPSQCSYSGNRYAVIWGQETGASTNAPSGTTADNAYWYYIAAGAADTSLSIIAWTSGLTWRAGGAYLTVNNSDITVLDNCYAEDGQFSQFANATLLTASYITATYCRGGVRIRAALGDLFIDNDTTIGGTLTATGVAHALGPLTGTADVTLVLNGRSNYGMLSLGNLGTTLLEVYGHAGVPGGIIKFFNELHLRHGATNTTILDLTSTGAAVTGVLTASGSLGYATGAGGAITQITSRTTGVTLNKICGAITLVSAAGSAAWQSFTVTNSTVAATDVVRVVQKSGTDLYMIHVTNVAAGSFKISFATTGGTTTEQPVFNFAVVKAVAS